MEVLNQHIVTEERVSHGVAAVYPVVKEEYCVMDRRCVNCISICPERAITAVKREDDPLRKSAFIETELCTKCGLCYQVCPTGAIEDKNAGVFYMLEALPSAGEGKNIVFACTHTGLTTALNNSELQTLNSELIFIPDVSILAWRDLFKIISMGVHVSIVACEDCSRTDHLKKLADMFEAHGYGEVLRVYENLVSFVADCSAGKPSGWEVFRGNGFAGGAVSHKKTFSEQTLEQLIASSKDKIAFPGTAWVDIGSKCTLCQNCANVCPTGALHIKREDSKVSLVYEHNLCKGCPACEKACPERCITIDRRLRLDALFSSDIKCEHKMLPCKGCGQPMITDAVFAKIKAALTAHGLPADYIEYCPDCKSRQLVV
ncbi:MAG: hypothetical protein A2073_06055 [Deltaproteobacteria bacterium GWC2_42_11]|nr:MAG: hypothetical protein A2073_06055 [Deltaproteobacteria bacterium GWC2_42_11]HBO84173.1 hypothetical protein [Deltaproteobacteria bacterium]